MPLSFTGRSQKSFDRGQELEARDAATGARVVVRVSEEAFADIAQAKLKAAASHKYDAGKIEPDGTVLVLSGDC